MMPVKERQDYICINMGPDCDNIPDFGQVKEKKHVEKEQKIERKKGDEPLPMYKALAEKINSLISQKIYRRGTQFTLPTVSDEFINNQ